MAAKVAKVPNYTAEMAEKVKGAYLAGQTVEQIAEEIGKTTKSVVAKLSRMGVYKAKTYVNKNGEKPVKKDEYADAIGLILGLSEPETESLTKVSKTALVKISKALTDAARAAVEETSETAEGETSETVEGETSETVEGDSAE